MCNYYANNEEIVCVAYITVCEQHLKAFWGCEVFQLANTCIVLYLYIYIALLAVPTNQKRFQCERPSEKRAVRERKEALGSPVNKVDRVKRGSWFKSKGPMIAKARV